MRPNSPKAWLLAARPKTLTAALIPVILGSALAFADRQFQTGEAVLCLLFACLMQVAANFINDLFDFRKGSDRSDRLGPQRACAEGWITPHAMTIGIGVVLALACACGLGVLYFAWGNLPHGGWELVLLGVLCLLFAFLYTTVLSYKGWGDVLVLVLRLRARRRNLLRTGRAGELGRMPAVARIGTGHRHIADGEQLPRPRTRPDQRETNIGREVRRTVRSRHVSGTGTGSRRHLCRPGLHRTAHVAGIYLGTVHLPLPAHPDVA